MRAIKGTSGGGGSSGAAVTTKTTTTAVIQTIDTVPIPLNGANLIKAEVVAIKDDFAQKGGFKVIAIYANNAGTVTLQGPVVYLHSQAQAGWEVTFAISGTNVLIRVKGAAATNISWKCSRNILTI